MLQARLGLAKLALGSEFQALGLVDVPRLGGNRRQNAGRGQDDQTDYPPKPRPAARRRLRKSFFFTFQTRHDHCPELKGALDDNIRAERFGITSALSDTFQEQS